MAYRYFEGVLPSGVPIKVRNLTGDDQALLTSAKGGRDTSSFNQMLAGAIVALGDNTNLNEKDVERMLANDRKDALIMVRQHSLKFQKEFEFKYDWPIAGTSKQLQEYSVPFNEGSFARIPYVWVREHMQAQGEQAPADNGYHDFPVLYNSYKEMLAEQAERTLTMPESGEVVQWMLLNGEREKQIAGIAADSRHVNTALQMRQPKVELGSQGENASVVTAWMVGKADILDVEAFRKEIRRVEGHIDTMLTIQNQVDTRTARVDLVGTVDFFFPSQAL